MPAGGTTSLHCSPPTGESWRSTFPATATSTGASSTPSTPGHARPWPSPRPREPRARPSSATAWAGFVALHAATAYSEYLTGAIIVVSPLRAATREDDTTRHARASRESRLCASEAEAIARFRPLPDQPSLPTSAVTSQPTPSPSRPTGGDGSSTGVYTTAPASGRLRRIGQLPNGCASGRARNVPGSRVRSALRAFRQLPIIEIPDAGHHIMLDQPLALATALWALLAIWTPLVPS
ncbi:MAG: alpha/beta hydrolase fold protein [Frankiales bacterium]|nr:alpha/beta hydrolase fold protein [Frankiales bacterium]